jgi:hypothetical protein
MHHYIWEITEVYREMLTAIIGSIIVRENIKPISTGICENMQSGRKVLYFVLEKPISESGERHIYDLVEKLHNKQNEN